MGMGQGVRTGLGHGGITCVLQTQISSYKINLVIHSILSQWNRRAGPGTDIRHSKWFPRLYWLKLMQT